MQGHRELSWSLACTELDYVNMAQDLNCICREAMIEKRIIRREETRAREASPDIAQVPGGGDMYGAGDDSYASARARCFPYSPHAVDPRLVWHTLQWNWDIISSLKSTRSGLTICQLVHHLKALHFLIAHHLGSRSTFSSTTKVLISIIHELPIPDNFSCLMNAKWMNKQGLPVTPSKYIIVWSREAARDVYRSKRDAAKHEIVDIRLREAQIKEDAQMAQFRALAAKGPIQIARRQ